MYDSGLDDLTDIVPDVIVIEVQGVESAPVGAALNEEAVIVPDQPVLMGLENVGILLAHEWSEPKTGSYALCGDTFRSITHTVGEFAVIDGQPVTDRSLPAVVDLKNICLTLLIDYTL